MARRRTLGFAGRAGVQGCVLVVAGGHQNLAELEAEEEIGRVALHALQGFLKEERGALALDVSSWVRVLGSLGSAGALAARYSSYPAMETSYCLMRRSLTCAHSEVSNQRSIGNGVIVPVYRRLEILLLLVHFSAMAAGNASTFDGSCSTRAWRSRGGFRSSPHCGPRGSAVRERPPRPYCE